LQVIDVRDPTNCVYVGGYVGVGYALGVAVSGKYAYLADVAGLQVIDVSNPANCVPVGGYGYGNTDECHGVAVSGKYAFVGSSPAAHQGVQVIDVSDPANCVRVGNYEPDSYVEGVAYVGNRLYLAAGSRGLVVLPSLAHVQFTVRVEAEPGVDFTIQTATNLALPTTWKPVLTTNVAAMPFDFVDFDVKQAGRPQKFYRVKQR
jgi:hypothetical protein